MAKSNRFDSGDLTIDVSQPERATLRFDWRGSFVELAAPRDLLPFLEQKLKGDGQRYTTVQFHVEALDYCNSAMIGMLARALRIAREHCREVEFSYNANARYQAKFVSVMDGVIRQDLKTLALVVFNPVDDGPKR